MKTIIFFPFEGQSSCTMDLNAWVCGLFCSKEIIFDAVHDQLDRSFNTKTLTEIGLGLHLASFELK